MITLSDEQLSQLKSDLETGGTFREFILQNDLRDEIRPINIRKQFIEKYGANTLKEIMENSFSLRIAKRWEKRAQNMNDINKIDNMIVGLEYVVSRLDSIKKEFLSSSSSS